MKSKIVVLLLILSAVAQPAWAKTTLKIAGESCKKTGETAAASDGKELKCTSKKWLATANTIPEKDMPGGKPNPGAVYATRADQQKEDQEAIVGKSVRLTGRTVSVNSAKLRGKVLTVQVRIFNRDKKAKPYNTFDWKLQTPNGQVIDPTFFAGQTIGSGDLVNGGFVEGSVPFEVVGKGPFFVIYKPDAFNEARGVWQVP